MQRGVSALRHLSRLNSRAGAGILAAGVLAPSTALCNAPGGTLLATPLHPFAQQIAKGKVEEYEETKASSQVKTTQLKTETTTIVVAGRQRTLAGWFSQLLAFAIDQLLDSAFRSVNQWIWGGWEDPQNTDFYGENKLLALAQSLLLLELDVFTFLRPYFR